MADVAYVVAAKLIVVENAFFAWTCPVSVAQDGKKRLASSVNACNSSHLQLNLLLHSQNHNHLPVHSHSHWDLLPVHSWDLLPVHSLNYCLYTASTTGIFYLYTAGTTTTCTQPQLLGSSSCTRAELLGFSAIQPQLVSTLCRPYTVDCKFVVDLQSTP